MDDNEHPRTLHALGGMLIGGVILVFAVVFAGGQTSTILSTVGSSVNGGATELQPTARPTARPTTGNEVADAAAAVPTLLIVRTGTLEIEVTDVTTALRDANAAVARGGGYVSGSTRSAEGADGVAEATYRIPSPAWDTTLSALRDLASRIRGEEITTEEVSGQVVDLTARITNLRATEAALQSIMAKATKISDVLDVQEQLTDTRGEIERLVADREHLEDRASFGSLTVTFRLPPVPAPSVTPKPVKGWDPGEDVAAATGKLVRVGQASTTAGIWLAIVGLPLLAGASVLAFVGWQVVRLVRWLVRRREAAPLDLAG